MSLFSSWMLGLVITLVVVGIAIVAINLYKTIRGKIDEKMGYGYTSPIMYIAVAVLAASSLVGSLVYAITNWK